jgi:2-C-methyl-D-erythritol 4-phosphate cytidylyltransferase
MKNFLLIVAGGTGTRMGTEIPKQFLDLAGKPMIIRTIQAFMKADPHMEIIIVVHPSWRDDLADMMQKYFPEKRYLVADGGDTRFQSVKNGLEKINEEGIVLIHDAARPFVSTETITRCIDETNRAGNAVPVIVVTDSLRRIGKTKSEPVYRDEYRIVQTPQCFLASEIKNAYQKKFKPQFTDDASVFEDAGGTINLIGGNPENIKLTFLSDFNFAEFICQTK